jgi:hypothetical protein
MPSLFETQQVALTPLLELHASNSPKIRLNPHNQRGSNSLS